MTLPLQEKYAVARQFYESLMKSQWLPESRILAYQERQLQQMLAHAYAQVPFYEEPLGRIRRPDGSFDLSRWNELPIIDRDVVGANPEAFHARSLPPGHHSLIDLSTSGSESGTAFMIRKTRFDHTGIACASFRYADWFGHDFKTPLAMIRAGFITSPDKEDPENVLWGPPWMPASDRSARYRLHISTPVDEQLNWLSGLGPVILNTLPSQAMVLAQRSEELGISLPITAVMTVGEFLSQDVRDEVMRIWKCRISDVYSTAETGLVAIECPNTGVYHLQTELSRAEVLCDDGTPCPTGELGRLVCTGLYNFAMPLIRYRFNDIVERGDACQCGRGLPVLKRIWGREKSLFKDSNGRYFQPHVSTQRLREIAGIREWQLVQATPTRYLLRVGRDVNAPEHRSLRDYLDQFLPSGSEVDLARTERFVRSKGGKHHPFIRED